MAAQVNTATECRQCHVNIFVLSSMYTASSQKLGTCKQSKTGGKEGIMQKLDCLGNEAIMVKHGYCHLQHVHK